jgi:small multidrug resistance pump
MTRATMWARLTVAITVEVTAALCLKGAIAQPALYALVVAGYAISFALLATILRGGMALGVVYGIWGAVGVGATAVMSWLLFDEPLTVPIVLGLVLVVSGVMLIELGSQAAHRREGGST